MRTRVLNIALAALLISAWLSSQAAEPALTPAEFEKLHRDLTSTKEAWQTMPWQVSLLEARALAVKENKPIYMLCRSGHPLGCV